MAMNNFNPKVWSMLRKLYHSNMFLGNQDTVTEQPCEKSKFVPRIFVKFVENNEAVFWEFFQDYSVRVWHLRRNPIFLGKISET